MQRLPLPSLYVYLHSPVERLLRNIATRGRDYEQNITANYLADIQQSYLAYFKTADKFPIVVIDTSKLDFVHNKTDYEYLKRLIVGQSYPNGVTYL